MSRGEPAVVIMARAPVPGAVKTRLEPLLGPVGCARLQAALIRRTVAIAHEVFAQGVYLALTAVTAETSALSHDAAILLEQRGEDLGQRMCRAAGDVFGRERGPVVIIGTDAPTLTPLLLGEATAVLGAGRDVVFGPAVDGGYYLVALARVVPEVFTIDPALWGGPEVLAASAEQTERTGLRMGLLPPLRDLDTPEDAAALLHGGALPSDIAALLSVAPEPA